VQGEVRRRRRARLHLSHLPPRALASIARVCARRYLGWILRKDRRRRFLVFLCGRLFVSECLCFGLAAWGAGVLSPFVSVSTTGVYFFLSLSILSSSLSTSKHERHQG
jgi:hypothetical protein